MEHRGYVEPGETPGQACEREISEELGFNKTAHFLSGVLVSDLGTVSPN
jgi:8-oxo-dGTP pyrophosphatase MutT (NUDIX family)